MAFKPLIEEEEDAYTMIIEREELMIPPTGGTLTLRNAHLLKPLLNPTNQPLPKLPSFSLSSKPNIHELKERVCFKGRVMPQKRWKQWVEDLQQTHQEIWEKVGIFDALRASTYNIRRDNGLIIALAEKWCSETNTFILPWGESTITLEDIIILGGFSVLGASVLSRSQNRVFDEIESKLAVASYNIRRKCGGSASHYGWMNYFKGRGCELEHVAFLVLWLSRYVFSTNYYNIITPNVFCIAITLANGTKIALAPAILASIYSDSTLLKQKIVASIGECGDDGSSNLVLWAPFQLVQLWAWERFPTLSPKPASLVHGEPRLARWHNVTKSKIGNLRKEIESGGDVFLWRPYALFLKNWEFPKFYCDDEMWVLVNSEVDEELLSFARCLRACELVGLGNVAQYLPHRVGMQFGFDQDIPDSVHRSNDDKLLDGLKLYVPPRLVKGYVTLQYYRWWRGALSLDDDALMVYERRRRSPVKVKKPSQVLQGSKQGNDEKASLCSPSPCNEVASFHSVESTKEMTMEMSPCCEGISSREPFGVVNECMRGSVNPVMGLEDTEKGKQLATEEYKEKEVIKSNKVTDGESVSVREAPIDMETQKSCSMHIEDILGKPAADADMKQVTDNSTNDVIVIDDVEEEDGNLQPFRSANFRAGC